MSTTIINPSQVSLIPVIVDPVPAANPEDLIYTLGGGTIFPNLVFDRVLPVNWYHGGNPILPPTAIKFFGCDILEITNTENKVISGLNKKGIQEFRIGNSLSILNITDLVPTTEIQTTINHGYSSGDIVEIQGVIGTFDANGVWYINVTGLDTFELIDSNNVPLASGSGGTVNLIQYYWDEVYTTPIGYFDAVDQFTAPALYQFNFTGDDSNEMVIRIDDPNIVPKIGDTLVIQRNFNETSASNPLNVNGGYTHTTDGINSVKVYSRAEKYDLKITGVSSIAGINFTTYTIEFDKSFRPILTLIPSSYTLILLNRDGVGVGRELLTDTWQQREIHREQLLGDPYDYTGVLSPQGRKNYLNYESQKYLGLRMLLSGIINDDKTPFVVFDYNDKVKDRLNDTINEFEVHLPAVMIQGERNSVILINSDVFATGIKTDLAGGGKYSELYLKNSTSTERYGWVFYDLRIAIIDHVELATAINYNSNRNYTLPAPKLETAGNSIKNLTKTNAALIINATNSSPIRITTNINHNLSSGDSVIITDVQGNLVANTPFNSYYYVSVFSPTQVDLYYETGLITPVDGTGANPYTPGTGKLISTKLPFEYFLTYRIKGQHYDSLPYSKLIDFNFQANGSVDNVTGNVELSIEQLTHLVDNTVLEGFETLSLLNNVGDIELIIGKYSQDIVDTSLITGIEDTVVLINDAEIAIPILSGAQASSHNFNISKVTYDNYVSSVPLSIYDIVTVMPIYSTFPLPSTFFTGEGQWLSGIVQYKEASNQYRLTIKFVIPPDKWNATTNPTFEVGNRFMQEKLISEVSFLLDDVNGVTDQKPYIYGKISPVIKKDNISAITLIMSLDF